MKVTVKENQNKLISSVRAFVVTEEIIALYIDLRGKGKWAEPGSFQELTPQRVVLPIKPTHGGHHDSQAQITFELPFASQAFAKTIGKYSIWVCFINKAMIEKKINLDNFLFVSEEKNEKE